MSDAKVSIKMAEGSAAEARELFSNGNIKDARAHAELCKKFADDFLHLTESAKQIERKREHNNSTYRNLTSGRRCCRCRGMADKNFTMCADCLEKHRIYQANIRNEK